MKETTDRLSSWINQRKHKSITRTRVVLSNIKWFILFKNNKKEFRLLIPVFLTVLCSMNDILWRPAHTRIAITINIWQTPTKILNISNKNRMLPKTKLATITTNKKNNYRLNNTSKCCMIVIAKTSVHWGILESKYGFFFVCCSFRARNKI